MPPPKSFKNSRCRWWKLFFPCFTWATFTAASIQWSSHKLSWLCLKFMTMVHTSAYHATLLCSRQEAEHLSQNLKSIISYSSHTFFLQILKLKCKCTTLNKRLLVHHANPIPVDKVLWRQVVCMLFWRLNNQDLQYIIVLSLSVLILIICAGLCVSGCCTRDDNFHCIVQPCV